MLLVKNLESILKIFKTLSKISIWFSITKEGGLDKNLSDKENCHRYSEAFVITNFIWNKLINWLEFFSW